MHYFLDPELRQHLLGRNLDPDRYTSVVAVDRVVTFWLQNLSGKFVGYLEYKFDKEKHHEDYPRSERKYYPHVPAKYDGKVKMVPLAVWGLETVRWDDPLLFVVEGVFDAVALHCLGLPAIAALSCNPNHLDSWLLTLPMKKVVVSDDDLAGRKLENHGDTFVRMPDGKDPGDMSLPELREMLGHFLPK